MEVLENHRLPSRLGLAPFVVLGSWADQRTKFEEQGLECKHVEITPSHTNPTLATDAMNEMAHHPNGTQQKRQLITVLQHLFAEWRSTSTKKRKSFSLGKLSRSRRDARSVASTAAESVDASTTSLQQHGSDPMADMVPYTIIVALETNDSDNDLWTDFEDGENVALMQRRLLKTGVVHTMDDFEFVVDRVSKEVADDFTDEEKRVNIDHTTHVKTGVWQVTCFETNGNPQPSYFVVTGVSMDDRVDTKKLRKALFAGQTHTRRPKLTLAPTKIAEGLVGFQSGTMAPICHTVNMKLFLEESVIPSNADLSVHKLNVGSGMFGKCLSISAEIFIKIAKLNSQGFEICKIVKK